MRVLVVRHAIAEEPDPSRWPDDSKRPLTDKGERRFAEVAGALARIPDAPDVIITSPFARARRTAELLVEHTGWEPLVTDEALASGARPDRIANLLGRSHHEYAVIVGHEPDLGRFVVWSIGATPGSITLKKGGAALLEDHELRAGGARLAWLLPPKLLRG